MFLRYCAQIRQRRQDLRLQQVAKYYYPNNRPWQIRTIPTNLPYQYLPTSATAFVSCIFLHSFCSYKYRRILCLGFCRSPFCYVAPYLFNFISSPRYPIVSAIKDDQFNSCICTLCSRLYNSVGTARWRIAYLFKNLSISKFVLNYKKKLPVHHKQVART